MGHRLPENVLVSERAFFDREAAGLSEEGLLIPADQIERYRQARLASRNAPKDALFAQLLPLEGKRVLDYGCGTGENTCLLAACGARVTAFDLSAESVAKGRRRAEIHGVSDRIDFHVATAGQTEFPAGSFDVVCGFNILHHLHQDLPPIYEEIARLLTPQGTAWFIEPVANSPVLRGLRRLAPVSCEATPDERQLLYSDFEPLHRHFSRVTFAHFYLLERLQRITGSHFRHTMRWLDYHTQRLFPFLHRYYGILLVRASR